MPQKKLLFLTLNTFSSTGGIEKVCRVAGKAMEELAEESDGRFGLFAMNDKPNDLLDQYVSSKHFRGFSGKKLEFVLQSIKAGRHYDIVILSHINLLVIGLLLKLLAPKTKVLLIAHGIEVWHPLPSWKIKALKKFDSILPVSHFTKEKMMALYGIDEKRMKVLNNCLDPFLKKKQLPGAGVNLKKKLGLRDSDYILFTLTRIKSSEQYKGYDKVIAALPEILKKYPQTKYLIAGKYDEEEKERIDHQIKELQVEGNVIFAGFVADDEIESFFNLADLYVMPSTGEGFGIVFIEALFYGKPVIAGNKDGSVDALANGKFGLLVDPEDRKMLAQAILQVIKHKNPFLPDAKMVEDRFGFAAYKEKLSLLLLARDS